LATCIVVALALGGLPIALAPSIAADGAGADRAVSCEAATAKLAKAKQRLKKLKQNGGSAEAIKAAKRKVKKAEKVVGKECGFDPVLYDVTAANATFDATVIGPPSEGCTPITRDAHWTSSLGPGGGPAKIEIYYRDKEGRPAAYVFAGPPHPGTPLITHGSGTATQTCSMPPPGNDGSVSCTFNLDFPNDSMSVGSDPDASKDPLTLNWFFGYNLFSYGAKNGGGCSYSGPFPPEILNTVYSPGLFVSPTDNPNPLEPNGVSTVSVSDFDEDVTLSYSGAASNSAPDGSSLEASWQMTYSLRRR
jgi:hypothetical protein